MLSRLRDRRPRAGCVALSFLGAIGGSCAFAVLGGALVPPHEVEQTTAVEAFERERAAAVAIGLAVADERTLDWGHADRHEVRFSLAAGECAALVAAAWGYVTASLARIEDARGAALATDRGLGLTAHAQWCALAPEQLVGAIEVGHQDGIVGRPRYSAGQVRYALLRGRPAGGIGALVRGELSLEGSRRGATREDALAHADRLASGRTPLAPPIEIADHRARLLPEDPTLFAVLLEHTRNGTRAAMIPRVDPLPTDVPPSWRPLAPPGLATPARALLGANPEGPEVPTVAFVLDAPKRVLAVVDPARLSPGCILVQLVRMRFGFATRARRLDARDDPQHDRNVASERVCGAREPITYVVDSSDRETYLLRLFAG